ncbi:hypothetical protein M3P05_18305 [Sansalvadorimonas sp. 2012CJ34-2]|uniref:Lipoprotein n=1 Tax=Parendozoicomonas callyspongiae TaxID=2942213 RepID=A0ABT0PKI4_9GAMM|nr:hypothetical protein [Sansalvadorimonas sp. 2012CJ34-2]MCL6271874.1 hypothetical protein [Sansalvadorimonas sp. 2012CJ34-2]
MTGVTTPLLLPLLRLATAAILCASLQACALAPMSEKLAESPTEPVTEDNSISSSCNDSSEGQITESVVKADALPAVTKESREDNQKEKLSEEDESTAKPRKKKKKLSPLERLRQLYFLPLLHPIGRGGG